MMVSTSEMIRVFGRIGLLSFGGPAAQIALMHHELVEERTWLTEAQFLRALSFCMLLPGPEAMQLATYAGWKRRGIMGGLIGGGLFVIPGAIVIAILALAYGAYGSLPWMQAVFLGVKATVVIIVIEALIKVSKRALTSSKHLIIAVLAFVALFAFAVPFPIVIAIAAIAGAFGRHAIDTAPSSPLPWRQSIAIVLVGAILWATPIGIVTAFDLPLLRDIGLFFSTLAVVTFGGAYAVLAYMTQEVVTGFGWLTTPQMMDALGLAETTPGPLILVTQFVGMMAGYLQGGVSTALLAGFMTLWLNGRPRLTSALSGITAAVVGVIANLSLWFALHVFFGIVTPISIGPLQLIVPEITTLQIVPVAIATLAAFLLLRRHWGLPLVLLICAIVGLFSTGLGLPL